MLVSLAMSSKQWGVLQKIPAAAPFEIHRIYMKSDGIFPNNAVYPTIIYKDAFHGSEHQGRHLITQSGEWTEPWVWGIFTYHHYHTKAWELLVCIQGSALIQLGGDSGPSISVSKGDLLLIPPGVAHKQLSDSGGFSLLGSYPTHRFDGRIDTSTGSASDEEKLRIQECFVPDTDPILNITVQSLLD